jgi:hypothetical protein
MLVESNANYGTICNSFPKSSDKSKCNITTQNYNSIIMCNDVTEKTMVTINLTLNNFSELPALLDLFNRFGNDYEYTIRGIFYEKFLLSVLFVVLLWFIMAIIPIANKVLEKSRLVDTNAQIVVVHRKNTVVFGKI